jgi:hypothetical protein
MRKELREAETEYFIATFETCSSYITRGRKKFSFLFTDVTDKNGKFLTDHIWVRAHLIKDVIGEEKLERGQKIKIYGFIDMYLKGYKGHRIAYKSSEIQLDYTITDIKKIEKIENNA